MNLPVIFSKAFQVTKGFAGNGMLLAKKHAPELMIGAGILGFGATIYETVKATNKTNDILDEKEATVATIESMRGECGEDEYPEHYYERDMKEANRRAKWGLVRAWAPVGTLGAASVISILGGYRVLAGESPEGAGGKQGDRGRQQTAENAEKAQEDCLRRGLQRDI